MLGRAERWARVAVEAPAALAVLAEIVILFAGVVARFGLSRPIVWGDELASGLFLWLAMLGAAAALGRGEHMRLETVVVRLPRRARAAAEALAVAGPALFLLIILGPAIDYADDQWFIETPALGWHDTVRSAALPTGCAAMLLLCALRLLRHRWRDVAVAAGLLAALAAALHLGAPWLRAAGNWNLLLFFVVLLGAGVLAGVPIGFTFGLAIAGYLLTATSAPLTIIVGRMDGGMSTLILLAVPLFVFLGQLIEMTGMARAMVGFLAALIGHVRGGLGYVLLAAMILVSGISGSKAADMAAVAPVLFPEMIRRGAREGELVALLAASGAMSETIPPSLVLITIGSVTGVSIAALFTGGLLPGIVLGAILAVMAWRRAGDEDLSGVVRAGWPAAARAFVVALPALALPVLIRTAVVEGVATATEVSTIGIAYAVLAGLLVYRQFPWRRLYPMLVQTASLSGAILLIIGAATAMAWGLTQSGFSQALAGAIAGVPGGRYGFLLVSIAAFVVLGSVLEGIPAIVLFGPLLFPVARTFGINEVHYAIVVILAMGIGLFAPPFGVGYYSACSIGRVAPDAGLRRIWPYLGALGLGLLVIAAVPWFSTGFLE